MLETESRPARLHAGSLRQLIGRRARYQGARYEIIEILEDGPSLVLQECGNHTIIQADQLGEAHRRVPPTLTLTVPVIEKDAADLEAIGLELEDIPTPATDSLVG